MYWLHYKTIRRRSSFWTAIRVLFTTFLLFAVINSGIAGDGYEVTGHLTYTAYGGAEEPTYKNVLMFQVQATENGWRVRSEPVIEGLGGIGFFEASSWTNNSILTLTAFRAAYNNEASPFGDLRSWLLENRRDAVFFSNQNPVVRVPDSIAKLYPSKTEPDSSITAKPSHANNVAVAKVIKGNFPPVTASQTALLWFAFRTSKVAETGSNHLFQIWDDGNRNRTRFRQARWEKFNAPPFLFAQAEYYWAGHQILEDDKQETINIVDVSAPWAVAARYKVEATTNLGGLVLPSVFKLERFDTKHTNRLVSTVEALVVAAKFLPKDDFSEVVFPGRTFVSDHRFSADKLGGNPLNYIVDSNRPPSAEELETSNSIRKSRHGANTPAKKSTFRFVFFLFFSVSVGAIVFVGWNQIKKKGNK